VKVQERRVWPAGKRPGRLPDGPVELWVAVFTGDGEFMGAAPAQTQPRWLWRDGRLSCNYTPVVVEVTHGGTYATGLICAVAGGAWQPLWPVTLGPPHKLRPGDDITITDGIIAITPDLPGPHG